MSPPLFDLNLNRVTREHYITGKAAINFPSNKGTGGWHFLSYWDRESGVVKVSLAGIHFPDTTELFGDEGIFDGLDQLAERGWRVEGRALFMADHFRAAADMIARWAMSEAKRCNVEIGDWFPAESDRQRFLDLLASGKPRLQELGKLGKVETWLDSQLARL
jgi:hypothetical protein